MCGIAGIVDLDQLRPVPRVWLRRMARALVHRGPDEEGFLERPGIGFASRRLSIVGLADGRQPIANEDGSISVVFNGEFYDYPERKRQLEAEGHVFSTHADTELLVHLYEKYGLGMPETLRGQFAFALLDARRRRVVLARDRFGIAPLYWARVNEHGGDWLVFASEVKALLASGLVTARPDPRGVDQIFNFLAIPGPASCFAGVSILPPGGMLTIDLGRAGEVPRIEERRYWQMDFPNAGQEGRGLSERDCVDRFEEALRGAVARRLRADVPVASYLSGGVDSSIVVALARDVLGEPPPTFTIKIRDPKLDETTEAKGVANHLGAEPHVVECGSEEIVANYQSLIVAAESPVTDTSCTALMLLAKRVREAGYKVALTGEGSDEWLAGYSWFKANRVLGTLGTWSGGLIERMARDALGSWLGFDERARRHQEMCIRSAGGRSAYHDFYGLLNVSRSRFYSEAMHQRLAGYDLYAALAPDLDRLAKWDPLNRSLYWGGRIHLPGQLLSLKGDRVAMSQSVETRYPFLDEEVFSLLADVPPRLKLKGLTEKYLLRRVAERWLPKEVAWRPKGMFRAPLDGFFLETRLAYVDELLSEPSLRKTGYFDPAAVQKWKRDYASLPDVLYRRSAMELGLVNVLATQLWHHTYIDPTLCSLPDWRGALGLSDAPDSAAGRDEVENAGT